MNAPNQSAGRRTDGRFSRRHQTNEAHEQARAEKQGKLNAHFATRERCATERKARTTAQQIAHLDTILGRGQGAVRERARLAKAK